MLVIEPQDLMIDVEVNGTLKAVEFEPIGVPPAVTRTWDFKIIRLVPEAASVKAGDEVVAFDPSELEKKLQDDETELARVNEEIEKTRAENAVAELEDRKTLEDAESTQRKSELKADKPVDLTPEAELKQSAIARDLAQRLTVSLRAQTQAKRRQVAAVLGVLLTRQSRASRRVAELQEQLAAMSVKCTHTGTVIYKQYGRGEKKKLGDTVSRSETVLEIAALERMEAQGQVDELYASHIAVGQPVRLRLEAHADKEYSGVVARVAPLVRTESAESRIKIVQLDIKLAENDPLLMRPGMRFRGGIELLRIPKVVQVPLSAIESTAQGPMVNKLQPSGAQVQSPVKLGRRGREAVEVLLGLSAGERILLRSVGSAASAKNSATPRLGPS
jgi:hypothetical protein